jgi:hypothetical protein
MHGPLNIKNLQTLYTQILIYLIIYLRYYMRFNGIHWFPEDDKNRTNILQLCQILRKKTVILNFFNLLVSLCELHNLTVAFFRPQEWLRNDNQNSSKMTILSRNKSYRVSVSLFFCSATADMISVMKVKSVYQEETVSSSMINFLSLTVRARRGSGI